MRKGRKKEEENSVKYLQVIPKTVDVGYYSIGRPNHSKKLSCLFIFRSTSKSAGILLFTTVSSCSLTYHNLKIWITALV